LGPDCRGYLIILSREESVSYFISFFISDKIKKDKREVSMKPTIKLLIAISISFIFLSVYAKENQNPQWKGTIEEEDGVKVIKNPKEPLYGELVFDLEEDLSIGNEKDDNYLLYKVRDIRVDNQGNIYVVDMGNHRIQIYDKDGNYLQTIGKVGQGPGDFQLPTKVQIEETTGIIYVLDMFREIDVFDEKREYIKSLHTDFIHGMIPVNDENIFIIAWKASDYDLSSVDILCKINFAGEITKFSQEYPFTRYARKLSSGATLSMSTGYELGLHLAKIDTHG
jgi:hypothetical protein